MHSRFSVRPLRQRAAVCSGLVGLLVFTSLASAAVYPSVATAQAAPREVRALTEDGRRVILSANGTWRLDPNTTGMPSVGTQQLAMGSPYQTSVKRFKVGFDTTVWAMVPARDGDDANKRQFRHKTLPLHAMVIADEIPASNAALHNLILLNARSVGATPTVVLDEERDLSGQKIGHLRFAASLQGLDYMFATYYFGSTDGNIQVTCFTAQAVFFKYQTTCQQFLAGLSIE